ncbi:hypothetical protein KC334_g721 [Hortaea werneckii]|nr:hypothetical protein KC334_g721 [Hortaea werneckii]
MPQTYPRPTYTREDASNRIETPNDGFVRQRNKQTSSRTSNDHAEEITFSAPILDMPSGNSPSQALATLFTNLGDAAQTDTGGSSNGSKEHIVFSSGTIDWSLFDGEQGHLYSGGEHGEVTGKVAEVGAKRPSPMIRSKTMPNPPYTAPLQRFSPPQQRPASDTTRRKSRLRQADEKFSDQRQVSIYQADFSESHKRMSHRVDKLCEELSSLYRFGVDMQLLSSDASLSVMLDETRSRFQKSILRALDNDTESQISSSKGSH